MEWFALIRRTDSQSLSDQQRAWTVSCSLVPSFVAVVATQDEALSHYRSSCAVPRRKHPSEVMARQEAARRAEALLGTSP